MPEHLLPFEEVLMEAHGTQAGCMRWSLAAMQLLLLASGFCLVLVFRKPPRFAVIAIPLRLLHVTFASNTTTVASHFWCQRIAINSESLPETFTQEDLRAQISTYNVAAIPSDPQALAPLSQQLESSHQRLYEGHQEINRALLNFPTTQQSRVKVCSGPAQVPE